MEEASPQAGRHRWRPMASIVSPSRVEEASPPAGRLPGVHLLAGEHEGTVESLKGYQGRIEELEERGLRHAGALGGQGLEGAGFEMGNGKGPRCSQGTVVIAARWMMGGCGMMSHAITLLIRVIVQRGRFGTLHTRRSRSVGPRHYTGFKPMSSALWRDAQYSVPQGSHRAPREFPFRVYWHSESFNPFQGVGTSATACVIFVAIIKGCRSFSEHQGIGGLFSTLVGEKACLLALLNPAYNPPAMFCERLQTSG